MTPAEKLAKSKPWRRSPRNKVKPRRIAFACRIRDVRESLRISLRDAAKACKISVTCLWQIEMGGDVRLTTARKLAAFFGKTTDELWEAR